MHTHLRFLAALILWCGVFYGEASARNLVIGATVSLEGPYREPSAMIQGAFKYWVQDMNSRGGLLGQKVTLVLYDDQSDADKVRRLYKKIIEEDQADFVLSPYSSPLTLAASEISESNKKLMLAVGAAANAPWERGFRYLFQLYTPADRQFIGLMDMMSRNGCKTLSLLYDQTSPFNADMARGAREWADRFNIAVLLEQGYTEGEKALPGLVAEVMDRQGSGLLLAAYPPDAYRLLDLLEAKQYRPKVLAMPIAPAHPGFLNKVGKQADKVFGPSQWEPHERIHFPGTRRFVDGFKSFTGQMPSFHAASAYSACELIEQAVNQTGSLDNTRLRDYIAALDTVTVLGRFKVDHSGKQIGHNSFMIQWQNGKKEIVWPRKMQTASPQF